MENPPSPSSSLLVLSGKSPKDIEFAQSLKNNNSLKIPVDDTGVSVFLHSSEEVDEPYSLEKAFKMDSYMNALSTDRFGRFLIWSPRLSSTQDLISQLFWWLSSLKRQPSYNLQEKNPSSSVRIHAFSPFSSSAAQSLGSSCNCHRAIGVLPPSFIQAFDKSILPHLQPHCRNFCQLPIEAACVADVQFKGRGRSKNVWESPMGCLLFTFTVQMDDGSIVPLLQYVVSLAVVEAIKDVCNANGFPYLDIKIKWPNDLYLNGLKVGGILCTSTYSSKKFNVSAGIGLNVDNEKPTTNLNATLGEMTSDAYELRREEILAAFFKRFEDFFDSFLSHVKPSEASATTVHITKHANLKTVAIAFIGFQALEESYYKAWLHSGQSVVIQEKNQGELVEDVAVTIQGLTSSGYLLAIGDDNQFYELHPDGNSFDFFKGLVRRKIE